VPFAVRRPAHRPPQHAPAEHLLPGALSCSGQLRHSFRPGALGGFSGWHAIVGGVSGWSMGEGSAAKQSWMAVACPWEELAPVIAAGLTRPFLNGVRIFIGQGNGYENWRSRSTATPTSRQLTRSRQ
jgi:hypothetical protein